MGRLEWLLFAGTVLSACGDGAADPLGGAAAGGSPAIGGSPEGGRDGAGGNAGGEAGGGVGDAVLIGPEDVSYLGSFEVPDNDGTGDPEGTFAYGGHALGYNAANDSLFYGGHDWYQKMAEVGIPADFSQMATVLQPFADPTDGHLGDIDDPSVKLGGSLVFDDRLIVTAYSYYDADISQDASHFASTLSLASTTDAEAPWVVAGAANARSKAGYMTAIPPEWRRSFGGPALTGNCCLAILGASSAGPSVTVFDPNEVGVVTGPADGHTVLFYPLDNPTTGNGTLANDIFMQGDFVAGVAFPPGTRSVLFFGTHGKGDYCYGPGTTDESLHGQPDGQGNVWCYDLVSSSKGPHAFPYVHQVWAYDADRLVEVKEGLRDAWDVTPYATFELTGVAEGGVASMAGATFDPATGRLFITERYGESPRVHVFSIAAPR